MSLSVIFADARARAKDLDAEFSSTGKIKGPLHGVPVCRALFPLSAVLAHHTDINRLVSKINVRDLYFLQKAIPANPNHQST